MNVTKVSLQHIFLNISKFSLYEEGYMYACKQKYQTKVSLKGISMNISALSLYEKGYMSMVAHRNIRQTYLTSVTFNQSYTIICQGVIAAEKYCAQWRQFLWGWGGSCPPTFWKSQQKVRHF